MGELAGMILWEPQTLQVLCTVQRLADLEEAGVAKDLSLHKPWLNKQKNFMADLVQLPS